MLQALDVTIIASTLPWIAVDFGEGLPAQLDHLGPSTSPRPPSSPIRGQAADIFGRHHLAAGLQSSLMMVGCASVRTGAPTWRLLPVPAASGRAHPGPLLAPASASGRPDHC